MNLTLEATIQYLRIGGVALGIPAAILLMVATTLRIINPPGELKRRIKELTPPPEEAAPEPIPIDLSNLKRVIRPYIPYEDEQIMLRLFDKAEAQVPIEWEIGLPSLFSEERSTAV